MNRLRRAVLGALVLAGALVAVPALGMQKVALLIGNTSYPGAPGQSGVWDRLPNAANDVQLVASGLRRDGFSVDIITNGTYAKISAAVARFALKSDGADFAVVYYSGHGFEYDRRSYLVPVDAPTSANESDLARRFVDFEQVANQVAQARVNIFFLDACRTAVSFVKVSRTQANSDVQARAFDDVDFPQHTKFAVVYSTARGEPALDAAPPPPNYSPFAWEVARDIVVPHVDIGIVFETIQTDVAEKTSSFNPSEAPYTYGTLGPGFYFNENPTVVAALMIHPENIRPIEVSEQQLATVDEPVLVLRVLREHSVFEIESLAGQGDATATYLLGYMYEFGVGVPVDLAQARDWLEKAAAMHTPSGQLELGYFLLHHASQPGDKQRALGLYESAARQGSAKAQAHLAIGLMDGTFSARTPENSDRGQELMKRAASRGYPYAMFALGTRDRITERPGLSVAAVAREKTNFAIPHGPFAADADTSAWLVRLRQMAGAGNAEASQWLCELAARRGDYRAALPDCMTAARMGAATAEARLAIAYHDGLGVPQSDDEARHWTRLALSQTVLRDDLRSTLLTFGYAF